MPFFEFNMHRQEAVRRRLFLLVGYVLVLFGLCNILACKDEVADRYAYHVKHAQGIFGTHKRLTITAAPGLVSTCEHTTEPNTACVRAGSPFAAIRAANGNIESAELELRIDNTSSEPSWHVYIEPLREEEAQDQRCARQNLGPPRDTSSRIADDQGTLLSLNIPRCAALVLVQAPEKTRMPRIYRVAVLGGSSMRLDEMRVFIQRLAQLQPPIDYVYFLDDVAIQNKQNSLQHLAELMDDGGLRWSMVMSPGRVERGYTALVDRQGSMDYVSRIYGIPLVIVDTADARISHRQRAALRRIRDCKRSACPRAVALMSIPPVAMTLFEVGIFRSQALAQDLLDILRETGVQTIVSSAEKGAGHQRFSDIELYDVGDAQGDEDFLQLTFVAAPEDAQACDGGLALQNHSRWTVSEPFRTCDESQACWRGVCLPRCTQDTDCESAADTCTSSGVCRQPCTERTCEKGFCGADGYCESAPFMRARWRSL